jgi:hypothetical protein
MKFSQRISKSPEVVPFQIDDMSIDLRNSLWNALFVHFLISIKDGSDWRSGDSKVFSQLATVNFFKTPVDEIPRSGIRYKENLKKWLFRSNWFEVYDLIDWAAQYGAHWNSWRPGNADYEKSVLFQKHVNEVLARENSGYRFINGSLAPITNAEEAAEIIHAVSRAGETPVSVHIRAALRLLSHREHPDFRNSIKESICAVESAAKFATNNAKATLGDALKSLEKGSALHPALRDGFSKLYGWTSDAEGIRHAMMDSANLSLADARFMLVACSAFSNYILDRSSAGN